MSDNNQFVNQQETEISIAAILALGFKKIRYVFIALIIGAVLLGGWKVFSSLKNASEQALSVEEKQEQNELLEKQLKTYETELEEQVLYKENAPMMQIDAEKTSKTVITYGIVADNSTLSTDDKTIIPASAFILDNYVSYFQTVDLKDIFDSSVKDDWLRELVSLQPLDKKENSSIFQVVIISDSKEKGTEYANIFSNWLKNSQSMIKHLSYDHVLYEISRTQTVENNATIAAKQKQVLDSIDEHTKNIKTVKADINSTTPLASISKKEVVKWAGIGAVLGAFLYCLYLLIRFISKMPVTSSREFEEKTSIAFFGSAYKKLNWNNKISESLLNERIFNSTEDANSFISENIKDSIPSNQKVLLVSSFYKDENVPQVKMIKEAIEKAGSTVIFTGKALTSATFISELSKADNIIILEEKWKSQWLNINSVLQTIYRKEKKITGFILD